VLPKVFDVFEELAALKTKVDELTKTTEALKKKVESLS
jgi:regulator of replication initiation timing